MRSRRLASPPSRPHPRPGGHGRMRNPRGDGGSLAPAHSSGGETCEARDLEVRRAVSDRWNRILDQKAVSLREHLLDEAAKVLLGELRQWPLAIEEVDEHTGAGI